MRLHDPPSQPVLDDDLLIEGDNFDALRWLRMTWAGRINCIYVDRRRLKCPSIVRTGNEPDVAQIVGDLPYGNRIGGYNRASGAGGGAAGR